MIQRILAVTVKELFQLRRDWRTTLALLAMPVVLLMIYGYALSFDVTDIRLGIVIGRWRDSVVRRRWRQLMGREQAVGLRVLEVRGIRHEGRF